MKKFVGLFALMLVAASAMADIQAPPRPGPTRKLGSGIAKVAFSSSYILDSIYTTNQNEGGTAAFTIGIVDGVSKTAYSTFFGAVETATFITPPYRAYHSKYEIPPSDLKNFW